MSASFRRFRFVVAPTAVTSTFTNIKNISLVTTSTTTSIRFASTTEFRGVTLPWESPTIPKDALTEKQWEDFGKEVISIARGCDAGPAAFEEALVAREQLETMLEGAGYAKSNINVAVFGGAVVNGVLELGGDVDFVAIADQEPNHAEASATVINMAKELRRLGLRSSAVPRARVPVVKTDRSSSALPGAPVHPIAHNAVFRYVRPATPTEQASLEEVLREQFNAQRIEWNGSSTLMATFPTTTEAVRAISWTKHCGQLEIPLRLPVDPRNGPEIYRYTFDLCLNSSGLQNSHLFRNYLSQYPFGRHMLLFLKRWARASGIVNTHDAMLASYAVGVMVIHFLVRVGMIPPLQLADAKDPLSLPKIPEYKPLEDESAGDVATLGFLVAHYMDYYANVFNYENQVVCTTTRRSLNKSVLRWGVAAAPPPPPPPPPGSSATTATITPTSARNPNKPPFFSFCIKDPYNTENIARNISPASTKKIKALHGVALNILLKEAGTSPKFVAEALIDPNGPAVGFAKQHSNQEGKSSIKRREYGTSTRSSSDVWEQQANKSNASGEQQTTSSENSNGVEHQQEEGEDALSPEAEARRALSKMAFQSRKESLSRVGEATARTHEQNRAAQDLTRTIVSWIRAGEPTKQQQQKSSTTQNK